MGNGSTAQSTLCRPGPLIRNMKSQLITDTQLTLTLDPRRDTSPSPCGCFEPLCLIGVIHLDFSYWQMAGWFCISMVSVVPASFCKRLDGGVYEKSGMPRRTTLAPIHDGSRRATPISSAIADNSSSLAIESWRTLRISVPCSCCDKTREQDGRVNPPCVFPASQAKSKDSDCADVDRKPASRSSTCPSQMISPKWSFVFSASISIAP